VPVEIDYTSLAGYDVTLSQIQATQADVIVLSNPAFLTYSTAEINAIRQYVEAGHGLIISYGKFRSADRALAPLVGLSSTIELGTGYFRDGIEYEAILQSHPLLHDVGAAYATGVPYMAVPADDGQSWDIQGGEIVAEALSVSGTVLGKGVIVANEAEAYRGVYFAHYPENLSGGSNADDMQLFYNALLWTPEPGTGLMVWMGLGGLTMVRHQGRGLCESMRSRV
jgi:hypothetical protein